MNYFTNQDFADVEGFLDYFGKNPRLRTKHEFNADQPGTSGFVFRGQSDSTWPLLSSAFRDYSLHRFSTQTTGSPPSKSGLRSWLGWHLQSELRAVSMFLEAADRLGIPTPVTYTSSHEHQALVRAAMHDEDSVDYDADFPSDIRLAELALGQHHGVPTRLLDWTESPYVAAYFAAAGACSFAGQARAVTSDRIAVIMLNTYQLHERSDRIRLVTVPRHANGFLRTQRGVFTHLPKANRYLLDHGRWPTVDDLFIDSDSNLEPPITLTLPSTKALELLRRLFDMGITRHSLMPTLDNAAQACCYILDIFRASGSRMEACPQSSSDV